MQTARVTDLLIGESLTIVKGQEKIVWIKKHDDRSVFKFRRMHFKNGKLLRVMDNHKLGTADDEELEIRLDSGWKRV
jgi:hypothetical protein